MGIERLITDREKTPMSFSSDISTPPPPINPHSTKTYVNFTIPSSLHLSKVKREEFIPMTQPHACHNAFVVSEEAAVLNKSKNTLSLISNVKGKTKFERTCVTCVF